MKKISKETSLVIGDRMLKERPLLYTSLGVKMAMQFFCNVLMFGAAGGENFYSIGDIYGGSEFFTIGASGPSADLLDAFNACDRIAAEITFQNPKNDDSMLLAVLSMQFFYPESTDSFHQLKIGFSVNGGECFREKEL
ncbi:MAG: hypothetical protein PHW24_04900 [Candidatus Moranbacteria bacterium]|nr:hypothetical protein [Candidatus Moranbacteria bacterium]